MVLMHELEAPYLVGKHSAEYFGGRPPVMPRTLMATRWGGVCVVGRGGVGRWVGLGTGALALKGAGCWGLLTCCMPPSGTHRGSMTPKCSSPPSPSPPPTPPIPPPTPHPKHPPAQPHSCTHLQAHAPRDPLHPSQPHPPHPRLQPRGLPCHRRFGRPGHALCRAINEGGTGGQRAQHSEAGALAATRHPQVGSERGLTFLGFVFGGPACFACICHNNPKNVRWSTIYA
jgi:hypothetical protein